MPIVIGRGGCTIEKLKNSTSTNIVFKEESNIEQLHRTCIISGLPENVELAAKKIQHILEDQPVIETHEIWVPYKTVLSMTAREHESLNHIQHSTNAKIILENDSNTTDLGMIGI